MVAKQRPEPTDRDKYVSKQMGVLYEMTSSIRLAIEMNDDFEAMSWLETIEQAVQLILGNAYLAGEAAVRNEIVLGLQVDHALLDVPEPPEM
jgi:hypothetical protein